MANRTALQTFGRSGNPMFRRNAFQPDATFDETDSTQRMTLAGAVNKTGILLVLCLVSAGYVWNRFFQSSEPAAVSGDRDSGRGPDFWNARRVAVGV